MAELFGVFLLGLVGSAHCVGMCGGFALLAHRPGRRPFARPALYHLGKATTYAVLGAVAGGLSAALGTLFTTAQQGLSIALGLGLVVMGLGLMGLVRRFDGAGLWSRVPALQRALRRLAGMKRPGSFFSLGLVNGLLPCGLVYAALALAATSGDAAQGALAMAVFGLATIPALALVGAAGSLLRPAWRQRLSWAGGLLVVLLGVLTIARGTPAFGDALHGLHEPASEAPHSMHMHHP